MEFQEGHYDPALRYFKIYCANLPAWSVLKPTVADHTKVRCDPDFGQAIPLAPRPDPSVCRGECYGMMKWRNVSGMISATPEANDVNESASVRHGPNALFRARTARRYKSLMNSRVVQMPQTRKLPEREVVELTEGAHLGSDTQGTNICGANCFYIWHKYVCEQFSSLMNLTKPRLIPRKSEDNKRAMLRHAAGNIISPDIRNETNERLTIPNTERALDEPSTSGFVNIQGTRMCSVCEENCCKYKGASERTDGFQTIDTQRGERYSEGDHDCWVSQRMQFQLRTWCWSGVQRAFIVETFLKNEESVIATQDSFRHRMSR
ncbi:hypothetical protein ANN_13275 [Periplaneta americana]|uniref:Uncharacterized protein n=1 Tax=Periplaneta americana TaxID=6978 RepID=A0ABQ8TIZ3_PERAM|nr:hypothetical protein ANN_13275 [Periplaneta americana]